MIMLSAYFQEQFFGLIVIAGEKLVKTARADAPFNNKRQAIYTQVKSLQKLCDTVIGSFEDE